jgi:prepilin peptidase CpaA
LALPVSSPALAALVAGVLVATVVDLRTRRIPNTLTGAMAVCGLALAATGLSALSVWGSVIGLVLGLAVMMPGHIFGATGAGDVKLMAAIGAIVGPALVLSAFFFTAIAGGVLAVVVAARRQRLAATLTGTRNLIAGSADARQTLDAAPAARRFAYGPAIAFGSVLAALIG